jgi:hypothetical protein
MENLENNGKFRKYIIMNYHKKLLLLLLKCGKIAWGYRFFY